MAMVTKMNLKVRLLTYSFVGILGYSLGSCSAQAEFRKDQIGLEQDVQSTITDTVLTETPDLYDLSQSYEGLDLRLESLLK